MRFSLDADWTSERYAQVLGDLENLCQDRNVKDVVLEWRGQAPSLWQLAWIAELLKRLRVRSVRWAWEMPGGGCPAWVLNAGGPNVRQQQGGIQH